MNTMANRTFGALGQDMVEALRHAFVEDGLTYEDLEAQSTALVGQFIPAEAIRYYGTKERWAVQRTRAAHGKTGLPANAQDKVDDVLNQVFDAIMSGEVSPKDLASLVGAFSALTKGGGALTPQNSGKTSREKVLDMIKEAKLGRTEPASDND